MRCRFRVALSAQRVIGESRPASGYGAEASGVAAGRRIGGDIGVADLSDEGGGRDGAAIQTGSARNGRRAGEIALGIGCSARAAGAAVYVEVFASANGTER